MQKLLAFSIIFRAAFSALRLEDVCKPVSPSFVFFDESFEHPYDLTHHFQRGRMLGQGSFGIVRSVEFGLRHYALAAVKEVENNPKALPELEALVAFSKRGVGPRFFGCQYTPSKILIVQEQMGHDLASDFTLLQFRKVPLSQFVLRIKDVVDQLARMSEFQMLHNDIKEDNVMTDEAFSRFTLIDFGLAQSTTEKLKPQGSPVYMSPGKWRSPPELPIPTDDLYSVGILAGVLNNDNGFSTVYQDYSKNPNGAPLPVGCFRVFLTDYCQKQIANNVKRLLTRANFGNYHRSRGRRTPDTINFTTLMALMIEYYDYPFTIHKTSEILGRIARDFEKIEGAPQDYRKPSRDNTFTARSDEPDFYDTSRKYPRIHPDDLANFELKLQVATSLQLKLEQDIQSELEARVVLLDAQEQNQRIADFARQIYAIPDDEKSKADIATQVKHSEAIVKEKFLQHKEVRDALLESRKYLEAYHKKSKVQKEVVQMVVKEAANLHASLMLTPIEEFPEHDEPIRASVQLNRGPKSRVSLRPEGSGTAANVGVILDKTKDIIKKFDNPTEDLPTMIELEAIENEPIGARTRRGITQLIGQAIKKKMTEKPLPPIDLPDQQTPKLSEEQIRRIDAKFATGVPLSFLTNLKDIVPESSEPTVKNLQAPDLLTAMRVLKILNSETVGIPFHDEPLKHPLLVISPEDVTFQRHQAKAFVRRII